MVVRCDFRAASVLIVLIILFYWLMLPSPNHKKIAVELEKKEISKQLTAVCDESETIQLKEKNADLMLEVAKFKKDIDDLKMKLSDEERDLSEQSTDMKIAADAQLKRVTDLLEEKQRLLKVASSGEQNLSTTAVNLMVPFKGIKLVHFDLKGAPPKINYLIEIIKLAKTFGANGFLIEYEDMFPWSGELSILARENHYTYDDIKQIVKTAFDNKMVLIPLVQTFGHLEFALKHKRFEHLRENKNISNSVCPLHNGTFLFLQSMLNQIHAAHPQSKWIHLGCDEVWNIKTCNKCSSASETTAKLFSTHVISLAKHCESMKTSDDESVKAIIWDDMMRSWNVEDLKKMGTFITPMVWAYTENLQNYHQFPVDMWEKYEKAFPSMWFASSFKGALKAWSDFVPIGQHLKNHLSWLKITTKLQNKGVNIDGIALTGWSRFDHYGPLCELLLAGIPTLALCLAVLDKGKFNDELHERVSKKLGFKSTFKIDIPRFNKYTPEEATYPGGEFYHVIGLFEKAMGWKAWSQARETGWTRPYQSKKNHLSFYHLNATIDGLGKSKSILDEIHANLQTVLLKYYDKEIVDEWMEDKYEYQKKDIDGSFENINRLIKSKEL